MPDGPSDCIFSDDRRYRYVLRHTFDHNRTNGTVNFIMLNPSTADEKQLDPTLRRCKGFADDWDYGSFVVTNLFAFRATDPQDMKREPKPIGYENDYHILRQASLASEVVLGWGAHGSYAGRGAYVLDLLRRNIKYTDHIYHLGLTGAGEPRHPLYLPKDAVRVRAL
jgi:hypothetical protein